MNTAHTSPDRIAAYLRVFWEPGQVAELRVLDACRGKNRLGTVSGYFDHPRCLAQEAAKFSGLAPGVYFTLNPVNPALLARAQNKVTTWAKSTTGDKDITRRRWFLVDLDPRRPSGISSTNAEKDASLTLARECRDWLSGLGWPAPVVCDSGNGIHLLYRVELANTREETARLSAALEAIAFQFADNAAVDIDLGTCNAARICKVYGTLAAKGSSTRDRPHRLAAVLDVPDQFAIVSVEQLDQLAAMVPGKESKGSPGQNRERRRGSFDLEAWLAEHNVSVSGPVPWKDGRKWIMNPCPWNPDHANRSAYIVQFSNGAIAAGCHHNACHGKDWHALRDVLEPGFQSARRGIKLAVSGAPVPESPAARSEPVADERPVIVVTTQEHQVNAEAVEALAADRSIYQRGGLLVRIVRDVSPAAKGIRRPLSPSIDPLRHPLLSERLAANARWLGVSGVGENATKMPAHPPGWCVSAVLARAEWPGIRYLEAVVDHPVLRPDGTILAANGYDAETGLLLESPFTWPAIADSPSQADAIAARDCLLEVVRDFPFASDVYRAAYLAALLTPLARFAFHGPAPLFLVDSNVRGAGKGLLLDVICRIVTGERFTIATYTSDEDELRKRITSLVLAGDRMVLFDNLDGKFGNAVLDAALTGTAWKDRMLGVNRMVQAPLHMTWYATGNNVAIASDTARRVLHLRLESPLERPEERGGFTYPNLLEWVAGNRTQLLVAALTILRAYCATGRPDQNLPPWGSFEGWSGVARSAVVWVGLPDPGETRVLLQAQADLAAESMTVLLRSLEQMDPARRGLTTNQIVATVRIDAEAHADLGDAVESLAGKLDARLLGNKLRTYRRRIFAGLYIDRVGTEHHAARWAVFPAAEFGRGVKDTPHTPHTPLAGESGESGECVSLQAGRAGDEDGAREDAQLSTTAIEAARDNSLPQAARPCPPAGVARYFQDELGRPCSESSAAMWSYAGASSWFDVETFPPPGLGDLPPGEVGP
jgi:hypothetical protein